MHLYDEEFVRTAYAAILKRNPDNEGLNYYLKRIRSGISRENLLIQLLKSPEAKIYNTKISGLPGYKLTDRVFNIPFIGAVVSALFFLVTIKSHLKDLRALENHLHRMSAAERRKAE